MSKVGKAVSKTVKSFTKLFKAPSVVVNDNSKEVATAINNQAEEERKAKEAATLKEKQEKEFREKVEKDQKTLDAQKAIGTSETSTTDLATSGLNEVNSDFSDTLMEDEDEKEKMKDAFLSFQSNRR